ncbi:MAG: cell wall-associated NlpC family hydrolase [Polaromonas sp.]|jgi:cell wall-associated NlpC family hydrolase
MRFRLIKPTLAPGMALALGLFISTTAHAAPTPDELDTWLADKGLLSQIQQVRQHVSLKASELVVHAIGFLGVPYQRGGNTVETGFDCSGFVKAIYEQTVGLVLPRRAEQQAAATQNIERKELLPGDLVFFNTMRRAFSHVGIYIGDGKFIHAPKPGAEVRVESLATTYWNRRFDGARRVDTGTDEASQSLAAALRSQVKP